LRYENSNRQAEAPCPLILLIDATKLDERNERSLTWRDGRVVYGGGLENR